MSKDFITTNIYELKRESRENLSIEINNGTILGQIGNDNIVVQCPIFGFSTVKSEKNKMEIRVDMCKVTLNLFYRSENLYITMDNSKGKFENLDIDYLYIDSLDSLIIFNNTFIRNLTINTYNSQIGGDVNVSGNSEILLKLYNSTIKVKLNTDKKIGVITKVNGNPAFLSVPNRLKENNAIVHIEADEKSKIEII